MSGFSPVGALPVAAVPGGFDVNFTVAGQLIFRGAAGDPPPVQQSYFYLRRPADIRSGPWTDVQQQGRSALTGGYAATSKFVSNTVVGPPSAAATSKFVTYVVIEPVQIMIARYDRMMPLWRPKPLMRDYTYIFSTNPAMIPPAPGPPGSALLPIQIFAPRRAMPEFMYPLPLYADDGDVMISVQW